MGIISGCENIKELAGTVTRYAKDSEKRHFSPFPWNKYDPAATEWWCVPASEYPSYRFGKGFFWTHDLCRDLPQYLGPIQCGLYIEKGLDRVVAGPYPAVRKKGYVLDGTWNAWAKLLEGLASGSVSEAATAVARNSGQTPLLRVAAWYASDPNDFDPHPQIVADDARGCRTPVDGGRVWFSVGDRGSLKVIDSRCIQEAIRPVIDSSSLAALSQALEPRKELNWCWVDFQIGVQLSLFEASSVSTKTEYWGADKIWRLLFQPWLPWII
jgi:hypothetical protein